jgi:hypothetical protein
MCVMTGRLAHIVRRDLGDCGDADHEQHDRERANRADPNAAPKFCGTTREPNTWRKRPQRPAQPSPTASIGRRSRVRGVDVEVQRGVEQRRGARAPERVGTDGRVLVGSPSGAIPVIRRAIP